MINFPRQARDEKCGSDYFDSFPVFNNVIDFGGSMPCQGFRVNEKDYDNRCVCSQSLDQAVDCVQFWRLALNVT